MAERARAAGIDPDKFRSTLCALEPSDRPMLCLLIRNDLETLTRDLWRYLRRWDQRATRRVVHQIVSLSATVGAEELHQRALTLQIRLREGRSEGLDALAREVDRRARLVRTALDEMTGAAG